jgi:DNA repair ATPase RecN
MNKEHEIIMTINKGKELASAKSTRKNDQRAIQQNLDRLQKGWDKLKKETQDRNSRLQSCKEHCRKYDKARDTFLAWLNGAEDKFDTFKLSSFKKADIDKQIKEVNAFKNDLWRHTGEFESTRSFGETFLTSCDKDKQGVTGELQEMKERWDALNNALLAKVQELEDAAARLNEFNDNVRDVKNALNRCEDRLASADDSKDPKLLQKIKAVSQ